MKLKSWDSSRINLNILGVLAFISGFLITMIFGWITGYLLNPQFELLKSTHYYYLIPFSVALLLLLVLLYKVSVQQIHGLVFFFAFVLSLTIADLFKLLAGVTQFQTTPFHRNGNIFSQIGDVMMPLAIIFLYVHLELIENKNISLFRGIGILGSGIPLVLGGILQQLVWWIPEITVFLNRPTLYQELTDLITVYLYIFGLIVLWVSIFGIKIMRDMVYFSNTSSIKVSSFLVMVGFSVFLTLFAILGVRDGLNLWSIVIGSKIQLFEIHTSWLILLGNLFLLIAYIQNPNFAYTVPFDVYQVVVMEKDEGITLFNFINEISHYNEGKTVKSELNAPALVAIQVLLKEITNAKGRLQTIDLSDKSLLFSTVERVTTIVIADKVSYILEKTNQSFALAFYQFNKSRIEKFDGEQSIFMESEKVLYRFFPFFL